MVNRRKKSKSSPDYWEERNLQRMNDAHENRAKHMDVINKAFDESEERLNKEIKGLIGKLNKLDLIDRRKAFFEELDYNEYEIMLKLLENPDISNKIKKHIKQKIKGETLRHRISRKARMERAIEKERIFILGVEDKQITEQLEQTYKNYIKTGPEPFVGVDRKRMYEVLNTKWSGENYSTRIWENTEQLAENIKEQLLQNYISGKTYNDIRKDIQNRYDVGRYEAMRLIRTETTYVRTMADLDDSKRRGIKAKRFSATLDSKTSKICREHDGLVISIDEIKPGTNAPPLHPHCRSHMTDLLEGWDYATGEELKVLLGEDPDKS